MDKLRGWITIGLLCLGLSACASLRSTVATVVPGIRLTLTVASLPPLTQTALRLPTRYVPAGMTPQAVIPSPGPTSPPALTNTPGLNVNIIDNLRSVTLSGVYIPSTFGWLTFTLCFFGWALFELWVNVRLWQPGSLNRDRLSRYLIIVGMLLSFALAVNAARLHAFDLTFFRPQVFYLGLGLMLVGLAFRGYAIWQLGQFFAPEVAIQPGQRVVDRGLYRYLRHPSYTGTFITIVGYGLALTNWLSLLIMLALPGIVYAFRMKVEEAALLEAFGEEYRAYMRRTKRLIPFVL
ncbi:MAG: methyltransferase family protein [Anaerolineales bacterium]